MAIRDQIIRFIREKYGCEPLPLFPRHPEYAVFRHEDCGKWFGLIMTAERNRLGLPGTGTAEFLSLKLSDPLLLDLLARQEGYVRGYPIARGNWITVLLDGTVPFEDIRPLLHESFLATASRETKLAFRSPREWIIPANPKYYDVQAAFRRSREIDWKQGKGIRKGDTVYLYVAAPVSAVLYRCTVTRTDIPCRFDSENVTIRALMSIRLDREYPPDRFTFEVLGREYGIHAVRGPRGIPRSLSEALNRD